MMLMGGRVIDKRGNVLAERPIKGEAREQEWVQSLGEAS
jgi:hypothetical protein